MPGDRITLGRDMFMNTSRRFLWWDWDKFKNKPHPSEKNVAGDSKGIASKAPVDSKAEEVPSPQAR